MVQSESHSCRSRLGFVEEFNQDEKSVARNRRVKIRRETPRGSCWLVLRLPARPMEFFCRSCLKSLEA